MNGSRRDFLSRSLKVPALVAFGSLAPRVLVRAAEQSAASGRDRVLVVIQLTGGNDGLNTVVPYRSDEYYRHRPTLGVPKGDVLRIDDELGFHPALKGMSALLEQGQLAVVQGVGYPSPNRSHFESMDIWHSCAHKEERRADGWLGRYLDHRQVNRPLDVPALHLGGEKQPLALSSQNVRVPSVRSLEQFHLIVGGDESVEDVRRLAEVRRATQDGLLGFVQSSTTTALEVSRKLAASSKPYRPKIPYPETQLAGKLKTVAQLIDAGLRTPVFYVELDGFDTHSQQAAAHEGLLRQWGDAVHAFLADVIDHGHAERVVVMCFSEFGRRVAENASEGTDHGAAAPMFLAGTKVKAGLVGAHPSLTDLDQGDLRHHTDFRQVYAAVLEKWLGTASEATLGGPFPPVDAIDAEG